MKIIVIGAGISGLSIARMLNKFHEVEILESSLEIGGIAKTEIIEGITYHKIGGHCFNSKYKEVMDFVFSFMPREEWHLVDRNARINFKDYEITYPIELAVNEIYQFDKDLAFEIAKDFFSANDDGLYKNLEEWFRKKFGNKLAEIYLIPYNTKIWGKSPSEMSHEWVVDKLPNPNLKSFFEALLETKKDIMPHSSFYYPNSNNQETFFKKMSDGLKIKCGIKVNKISKRENKWILNEEYIADLVISTMPLNILPNIIDNVPNKIIDYSKLLKYNKISTMLWESKPTNKTWTYQPLKEAIFHRYIHIGNFFKPQKNYTITESLGERTFEEMSNEGLKDSFLIRPIAHNISDHAYVVFDENRQAAIDEIQKFLDEIGFISLGRFGQWDYFNMDICILQSMKIFEKIKKTYL